MSDIKVGDKVKSLVDYFEIRKGDVLTVDSLEESYGVLVEGHKKGSNLLMNDEYKKIEEETK